MKFSYVVLDVESSYGNKKFPWVEGSYLSSVGIEFPDKSSRTWFFNPLIGDEKKNWQEIQDILNSTELLVGHNIKFDALWLLKTGFKLPPKFYDTMVGKYLLSGQRARGELSLNSVADEYEEGQKVDGMHEWWDNGFDTHEIPVDFHRKYLSQDIALTHRIYLKQKEDIKKYKLTQVMELSCAMTKILTSVEFNGAPFSKRKALGYLEEAKVQTKETIAKLIELVGIEFNPASSQQLAAILYGGTFEKDATETYEVTLKSGVVKTKTRKIKVPVEYPGVGFVCPEAGFSKKTGKPTTSKKYLASFKTKTKLQSQVKDLLLQRSLTDKMVSTIAGKNGDKGWLNLVSTVDNRLHGSFNQTFTYTGRLSSSNPNMQNLPRSGTSPLKSVFDVGPGKVLINADLAQMEWRGAAELSRDPVMLEELFNGIDIHTDNAVNLLGAHREDSVSLDEKVQKEFKAIRAHAKLASFRLLYGGSAYGFHMAPDMPDYPLKQWEYFVNGFFNKYQGLVAWHKKMQALALEQGYIRTPSGRYLNFGDVNFADDKQRREWERQVVNYPVQSFCADLLNIACTEIIRILNILGIKATLIFLVHDSLVFETKEEDAQKVIYVCLETFKHIPDLVLEKFGYQMVVPIFGDCEIGFNYGETVTVDENNCYEELAKLRLKKEKKNVVDV